MNFLFLFLNIMCWTVAPVGIKWLSRYFDMHTQNFYRYLGASIFILIMAKITDPLPRREIPRNIKNVLVPAVFMAASQILWVSGIYISGAALTMFIANIDLLFIILFSYFIFQDEKKKIRTSRFKTGVVMVLFGIGGIILGRGKIFAGGIGWGIFFIFLSRITWALYVVTLKLVISNTPALISSSLAITLATVFLFPVCLGWGSLNKICDMPFWVNVILFGSGIIGIGLGQALFHRNIKKIGAVITSSVMLSTPLFVLILAYFLLGEKFTLFQFLSGLLILIGCYIILPLAQKVPYRTAG